MNSQRENTPKIPRARRTRTLWIGVLAGLAALTLTLVVGEGLLHAQWLPPVRRPDANEQNEINQQKTQKENFEAANAARKKLITEESALLLKLATDLKTEVDKTNQDTLSLTVIRRADAIEKLAHDVKEKMRLTVGTD